MLIWRHHPSAKHVNQIAAEYPYMLYLNADSMYNCCGASSFLANAALNGTLPVLLLMHLSQQSFKGPRAISGVVPLLV